MKNYYTYAYLREDKTPFYIGRGVGNRMYVPHIRCGKVWVSPRNHRILILKKNLTKEQSLDHEVYMIAILGRVDLGTGILHNLTAGGEGTSGYKRKHTSQTKIKISEGCVGRTFSQDQRTKRSLDQTGKRWWSNGKCDKFCFDQPGPEWYNGRINGKKPYL